MRGLERFRVQSFVQVPDFERRSPVRRPQSDGLKCPVRLKVASGSAWLSGPRKIAPDKSMQGCSREVCNFRLAVVAWMTPGGRWAGGLARSRVPLHRTFVEASGRVGMKYCRRAWAIAGGASEALVAGPGLAGRANRFRAVGRLVPGPDLAACARGLGRLAIASWQADRRCCPRCRCGVLCIRSL